MGLTSGQSHAAHQQPIQLPARLHLCSPQRGTASLIPPPNPQPFSWEVAVQGGGCWQRPPLPSPSAPCPSTEGCRSPPPAPPTLLRPHLRIPPSPYQVLLGVCIHTPVDNPWSMSCEVEIQQQRSKNHYPSGAKSISRTFFTIGRMIHHQPKWFSSK